MTDDTLFYEMRGSMTNRTKFCSNEQRAGDDRASLLNDDSMLRNAKALASKIDKATESLEDTGPLSVLGTMASSLFLINR